MTNDNRDGIQFLLTVPPQRVDDLTQALREAGFDFDPVNHMAAIDLGVETVTSGVSQGEDLPDQIDSMNRRLSSHGETRLIRTDHETWTHRQRFAALRLIATQLSGLGTVHGLPWWLVQKSRWDPDITSRNPDVPWTDS